MGSNPRPDPTTLPLQRPETISLARKVHAVSLRCPGWICQDPTGHLYALQEWNWMRDGATPYLPRIFGPLVDLLEYRLRGKSRWGIAQVEGGYRCRVIGEVEIVAEGWTPGEAVARVIVQVPRVR
jgi:hypothetical protein